MHVYHYYATHYISSTSTQHLDGLFRTEEKITNFKQYEVLRDRIAEENACDKSKVIICSLNYLGKEK